MASENDAPCQADPNFAIICAFIEKFGEAIGVTNLDFQELESMLENTNEVPSYLVELHIKLLRKIRKSVQIEKWEKSLIKLCHSFSTQDARELEIFGYRNAKTSSKLRILKELLEMQFDYNLKFKTEVNKLSSKELRSQPLGRDKFGHAYWFHGDNNYQIRVYKEDLDDEKWTLVAKNREGLVSLINTLNDGDRISSDSVGNEDSNSLSEKPVIDTGQQDTEDSKKTSDEDDCTNPKKIEAEEINEPEDSNSSSLKRPRDEDEEAENDENDGQAPTKYQITSPDVTENDTTTSNPIIGEAIEEPVMKIEGEGTGAENESPIIGETIEESVMYFYGSGSGVSCGTGKQSEASEEAPQTSTKNANDEEYSKPITNSKPDEPPCETIKSVDTVDCTDKDQSQYIDNKNEEVEKDCKELVNNSQESITSEKNKTEDLSPTNKAEISKIELTNEIKNELEQLKEEVAEPLCVKRLAYICGPKEDQVNKDLENSSERDPENGPEKDPENGSEKDPENGKAEKETTENNDEHNRSDEPQGVQHSTVDESDDIVENHKSPKEEENKITRSEDGKTVIEEVDSSSQDVKAVQEPEPPAEPQTVVVPEQEIKEASPSVVNSLDVNCRRPIKKAIRKITTNFKKVDENEENEDQVNNTESPVVDTIQSEGVDSCAASGEPSNDNNCNSNSESDPLAVPEPNDENQDEKSPTLPTEPSSPAEVATSVVTTTTPIISPESNITTTTATISENITPSTQTLSSFSLDFDESAPPPPIITPSPMRAVRKRGRDEALDLQNSDNGPEKRMKIKNRRQIDTALRKSVEQRIEQLNGSSSDSKESDDEKSPTTKTNRVFKKKYSDDNKPKQTIKRTPEKKNSRVLAGVDIENLSDRPLRQSRRIAQLKIKEQMEAKTDTKSEATGDTKKNKTDKSTKASENQKRNKEEESSGSETVVDKKKKKKKEKPVSQLFNEKRPWQSSTDDSEDAVEEEEDEEEIAYEEDVPLGELKSDHEFSPESDLGNDEEWQPMKRARTARKESDQEDIDDLPCQKCRQMDHPEWILLCDKCDNGWHCSCLRPPLLGIPEGDWYCPPCQHDILLDRLHEKLDEYDKKLVKKELEDRRKERLAYVGISLNNVLPSKDPTEHRKKKRRHTASQNESSSSVESGSEYSNLDSESDSDEPIYQLRQRRQAKSYKFNEYDEMMKSAIGEEMEKPEDTAGNLGRGKDIQTIVKGLEPEPKAPKNTAEKPPTNLKKMLRKKHRKLNSLESDSEEEDISDEDFKGSSSESNDEEEDDEEVDSSEDSDNYSRRRKNIRRSTRAQTRRYDSDFINDDSEEEAPKPKKKKSIWDESEESEDYSESSGERRKKRNKKGKNKKNKKSGSKKSRIKFGGLSSSEEELGRGRRTRGKKATYVESMGSDSEEESVRPKKNPRKIDSDDDEDFVANEEEEEDRASDDVQDVEEEEEEEEEEEDAEEEKERLEKRSLLVPKIYIKKPMGVKAPVQKEMDVKVVPSVIQENSNESNSLGKLSELDINKDAQRDLSDINEKEKSSLSSIQSAENSPHSMTKDHHMNEVGEKENSEHETEDDEDDPVDQLSGSARVKILGKRSRNPKKSPEQNISSVNTDSKVLNDDRADLSNTSAVINELSSNSANSNDASGEEAPKKRRGLGSSKRKTLEESLATIGNKSLVNALSSDKPAIEIAAPPQPFSQAQPTPSIITRMLQTKPGQTALYPVGSIRPKQFAAMPDDDSSNDSLKTTQDLSVAVPSAGVDPSVALGGTIRSALNSPYRPPHLGMNHYSRGPHLMREPLQMLGPPSHRPPTLVRGPPPPPSPVLHGPPGSHGVQGHGIPPVSLHGPPTSLYHHSRTLDPSPSGGGPINLSDTRTSLSAGSSYPGAISQAPPVNVLSGQRPPTHLTPHPYQPPPITALSQPSTGTYYGNYPPPPPSSTSREPSGPQPPYESVSRGNEPPYAPVTYTGGGNGSSHEHSTAVNAPIENSSGKTYEEDGGSGGEFAGLASYFSSQREDDLES